MAGIEDLKKQMSQIADDEYYAGLQSLFERDPASKEYFDTSAITYPAMEKSGNYNYKGFVMTGDEKNPSAYMKQYIEDRDLDKIIPLYDDEYYSGPKIQSGFMEKVKKGEEPIAILQKPVSTGSEPGDLDKIQTILHEMRHKTLGTPKFQDFLMDRGLKEETLVRYLDQEFFPELDPNLPDFVDPKKADKIYKKAVADYLDMFASSNEKGFLSKLKNIFAKGGLVDKPLLGRSRDI